MSKDLPRSLRFGDATLELGSHFYEVRWRDGLVGTVPSVRVYEELAATREALELALIALRERTDHPSSTELRLSALLVRLRIVEE